jgi:hypothetical protein
MLMEVIVNLIIVPLIYDDGAFNYSKVQLKINNEIISIPITHCPYTFLDDSSFGLPKVQFENSIGIRRHLRIFKMFLLRDTFNNFERMWKDFLMYGNLSQLYYLLLIACIIRIVRKVINIQLENAEFPPPIMLKLNGRWNYEKKRSFKSDFGYG